MSGYKNRHELRTMSADEFLDYVADLQLSAEILLGLERNSLNCLSLRQIGNIVAYNCPNNGLFVATLKYSDKLWSDRARWINN